MAWQEYDAEAVVKFAEVTTEGAVGEVIGVGPATNPQVAASSSALLAVAFAYDGDEVAAQLVGPDNSIENYTPISGTDYISHDHDVASDGQDFLMVFRCSTHAGDDACPGTATGSRMFSVEIDGETGEERPETRQAISGVIAPGTDGRRHADVTFARGQYMTVHEEFYAERIDVHFDDEFVFASAESPAVAAYENTGLVTADRPGVGVVGRFFAFGATPGPSATPTPSPEPTSTPPATPVPTPAADPPADDSGSGCRCSTTRRQRANVAPALVIALVVVLRARRRVLSTPGS